MTFDEVVTNDPSVLDWAYTSNNGIVTTGKEYIKRYKQIVNGRYEFDSKRQSTHFDLAFIRGK